MKKIKQYLYILRNNIVAQNIILVGIITFIIKGLGFFKETIVASNFGLTEVLDTFFIAILVPTFISNVFLGAYQSVFVPNYIAELKIKGDRASFQSSGFIVTLLVSIFFMFIAYLATDVFLENLYPGHDTEFYTLVKQQFYLMLPCVVFWGFSSLFGALLNIASAYRLSSFANALTPISVILSLFFLKDILGAKVLAFGTLVGSALSFIYLLTLATSKKLIALAPPNFNNRNIKILFRQIPAKVGSGLLTGLNPVVDQFFAAKLAIGSIAALNYGLKIPAFITGLVTIAISNVMLPYFSKSIFEDKNKTYSILFKSLKIVFLGVSILVILGFFFSEEIIEILFERKEFTKNDTIVVSQIQQIFLVYLPFSISGMLMVNFLTSINKNAIMAYTALVAVFLNLLFDFLLIEHYAIIGIALSTTIIVILKNVYTFIYIRSLRNKEISSEL
ncbi:murein biosynthesis integral membrane protein MurJ [Zobellia alginiliquefaciens]|uniref:murein biosynthesis integral membrane protein MurJ n=1 Tax=Zobellia alginiliquefaciens TaxID=3032586 RepID=UPI0023E3BD4F|nr:lipid II flippase MurJ [Zobellia alginiliquefaciens]